jgi:hypothetical protein
LRIISPRNTIGTGTTMRVLYGSGTFACTFVNEPCCRQILNDVAE